VVVVVPLALPVEKPLTGSPDVSTSFKKIIKIFAPSARSVAHVQAKVLLVPRIAEGTMYCHIVVFPEPDESTVSISVKELPSSVTELKTPPPVIQYADAKIHTSASDGIDMD